jgi:predicted esterase
VTRSDISRRRFVAIAGNGLAWVAIAQACRARWPANDGRLTARPRAGAGAGTTAGANASGGGTSVGVSTGGTSALGLESGRDGILQLPPRSDGRPLPLLVLLHGASGSGEKMLGRLGTAPADAGVAVLAPDSRGGTWDAIRDGFGPDVAFLDRALQSVFDRVAVDPARVTIGGFSDGATYALSLGLINGDLFPKVVAFSPGFIVEGPVHGKPEFFFSHGTSDPILPIDQCSRQIVPALRKRGYDVTFREFDGGHEVPGAVAHEAMSWIAK